MTDLYFLYPLIIGGILRTPDSATSLKLIRGGKGNIKGFMFLTKKRYEVSSESYFILKLPTMFRKFA